MPGTDRTMAPPAIATWARRAGWTGQDVRIAVAVAMAESGGKTAATHRNSNGTVDYGLWQINSIHTAILASGGDWSDPGNNASMAHKIWQSSGWRAWSTYKNGAYMKYLGLNLEDDASGIIGSTVGVGIDASNTGQQFAETLGQGEQEKAQASIGDFFTLITNPNTWWRAGFIIGGGVMLFVGATMMAKNAGRFIPKVTS